MPTKLDEDVVDKIIQLVELGNYPAVAAAASGVSAGTLNLWKREGYLIRESYPELSVEDLENTHGPDELNARQQLLLKLAIGLEGAEARAESFAVIAVRKHFPDQWTAAMTFLERRHPERWRKQQTIEAATQGTIEGIDEQALISDPAASKLLHEALEHVANAQRESRERKALPAYDAEGEVVEAETGAQ